MELREWLIILGLVLVTIIVVDGVRRLQRQRKVPRLDHAERREEREDGTAVSQAEADPEAAARAAEVNWELPNGGARVVKPATQPTVAPKPKLQRQEHPGPSKVFSRMAQEQEQEQAQEKPSTRSAPPLRAAHKTHSRPTPQPAESEQAEAPRSASRAESEQQGEARSATRPIATDDTPQKQAQPQPSRPTYETFSSVGEESEQSTFSRAGMAAALRSGGQRVSQSMQRMSSAFQRHDEPSSPHREPSLGATADFAAEAPERPSDVHSDISPVEDDRQSVAAADAGGPQAEFENEFSDPARSDCEPAAVHQADDATSMDASEDERIASHPVSHPVVEKARRHHVSAQRARESLAHAEEIIVISVMARNEEGFAGPDLLNLMLACGLRYSEMGIFLRHETEEPDSELQFAMVDVIKPGVFDLETMDDFATPGVTFLMPLPAAMDAAAAFEAMVETAMVLVRNLGGELKDENRSVMTAQTVEFARQRVQEFGRRHRLHRYQAN
ncbi:cell division protein ZipA [Halomonas sp. GXIMD04776]|uniref:cell division protein ZipA n=1 Tax=Halomonas sp. GXIMD04776 TaxID=3415605 RepID=UPI003C8B35B3